MRSLGDSNMSVKKKKQKPDWMLQIRIHIKINRNVLWGKWEIKVLCWHLQVSRLQSWWLYKYPSCSAKGNNDYWTQSEIEKKSSWEKDVRPWLRSQVSPRQGWIDVFSHEDMCKINNCPKETEPFFWCTLYLRSYCVCFLCCVASLSPLQLMCTECTEHQWIYSK